MRSLLALLAILGGVAAASLSAAEEAAVPAAPPTCCHHCGCGQLKKVCKMVPGVKKETKTKWVVECEDVCLPGPSCKVGERCVPDCEAHGGTRKENIWEPNCGMIVTKKKLKAISETVEKPIMKCVVETICVQCGCCCK